MKKTKRPDGTRRSLRLESLEAREMLAVSLLSSPVAAYAQQDNPAEIRFELSTEADMSAQIDFVVKQVSGSTLNPSAPTLVNRSTGEIMALTDLVDGTTGSGASALLTSGSYSIFVRADSGQGDFTLDLLQEPAAVTSSITTSSTATSTTVSVKSGLDVLVAAAISQQQAGWSYRIAYYNGLLQGTDYAGAAGMKPIATLYPEVDVNGDGVVNGADLTLAGQLIDAAGTGGALTGDEEIVAAVPMATISSVYVVPQDRTAPAITIGLKNDTGTIGDHITTDPVLVGRVTDVSGIKSASYRIGNGSAALLSLDSSGNFTISNSTISNTDLAAGTYTVTVGATDTKGNTSTSKYTFTLVAATSSGNIAGSSVSPGGFGTAKLPGTTTLRSVDGLAISAGKTVTLPQNKGAVALASNGTLTFTPGSDYVRLAEGETETLSLALVSVDAYGHTLASTVSFTVIGKNELPTLADPTRPNLNVDENDSATIAAATLLGKWTDPDNGTSLSIASASLVSVGCSNTALADTLTVAALSHCVTLTSSGVKLDTSSSAFDVLGAGETLTLTVAYTVKDRYGVSGDTGYLTFTVFGRNDAPTLTCRQDSGFVFVSNSKTDVTIDPGFTASDVDRNDAAALVYNLDTASKNRGFRIDADGVITIDRGRTADLDGTCTLTVTLRDGHGGSATKDVTVSFSAQAAPVLREIRLVAGEKSGSVSVNLENSLTKTPGHVYSFSALPAPTHYSADGVDWISISDCDRDWSDCWNFDPATGVFEFRPGGKFDDLTRGDSLFFRFQYAVSDDGYDNCESTGSLLVEVVGENDVPMRNPDAPAKALIVTESDSAAVEKIGNLLADWSDADHAGSELEITGLRILSISPATSISPEELRSAAAKFLTITDNGRSIGIDPSHEVFRQLGTGRNVTITIEYTVSDPEGGLGTGTAIFIVNGANDAPVFLGGTVAPVPAATTVEIDWRSFFSDVDLDDRLTLTGIDGTDFDENGKATVPGLGEFHLDAEGKLRFTPDAAFETLKSTSSATFSVTLDVEDASKAKPGNRAAISITITGTNKPPVVAENFVTSGSIVEPVVISVDEIASDLNDDALIFHSIRLGETGPGARSLVLDSGTTVLIHSDGKALTVDGTTRNEFLPIGETERISLSVAVSDEHGAVSGYEIVTVILEGIPALAPAVENHTVTGIAEDDAMAPPPVVLAELIADPNRPGRSGDDWYTIDWHGLAEVRLEGKSMDPGFLDEGLWTYENGVLTFGKAPAGYFDFLGQGETLVLQFSYTVTDDRFKNDSDGTVAVEITGVNDDPAVIGNDDFHITHSGLGSGSDVFVGTFEATDPDHGDRPLLSVGDVTGTKDGNPLETCPVFTIDRDGNLSMDKTGVPDLRPGESAAFFVQILAEDGNGGRTAKTIAVSVYAKNPPAVDISDLAADEGDFSVSTSIDVADVADVFRNETRAGNGWYAAPSVVGAAVSEKFAEAVSDPASFFTVTGNGIDGYSLAFTGAKSDFAFLRQDEELSFFVTIAVDDGEYGATTTKTVTATVFGRGDLHTVESYTASFDYWANRRGGWPNVFDPACVIVDLDRHSTYSYSIVDTDIVGMPENTDLESLERLLRIDAGTGKITLDESGLAGLSGGFKYSLTVRIASTDDHHHADVVVDLYVNIAGAPVVSSIDMSTAETGSVSKKIDVDCPEDGISRSADWYEISDPVLTGVDYKGNGTLPAGFDFAGLANIEGGDFGFETGSKLAFLPEGSTLVLTYEFTVTDKEFDTKTTGTATVTVTGKNDRPSAPIRYWTDGVHETGDTGDHEVSLLDIHALVEDIDLGDTHTIVSIDGHGLDHDTWVEIPGKGKFRYTGGVPGQDGLYYGGSLLYLPSSPALESLRHGEKSYLTFEFLLRDDSGCAATSVTEGSFIVAVLGTNKSPEVEAGLRRELDEGETLRIYADEIATDTNTGDTLRFHQVDGHDENFRLDDGTTVVFGDDGLWIDIDTSTRYVELNMRPREDAEHSLDVVIVDDSGADNRYSSPRALLVRIDGVEDPPVMPETHEFTVSLDGRDGQDARDFVNVGRLDFVDPDTELEKYVFEIVGPAELPDFVFDEEVPNWLYFHYYANKFLEGTYTFKVVATHVDDATVFCETMVTIVLTKTKTSTAVDDSENLDTLDETGGVGGILG